MALTNPIANAYAQAYSTPSPATPELTLAERSLQASKVLASRYDWLNQMIQMVEDFFRALKCPVGAYTFYNTVEDDRGERFYDVLGFAKQNDKWRIVHGSDRDRNDGAPYDIQPLADCPVEVRVRAALEIPKLHEKIVEQKEKFIPTIEAAIVELTKFIDTLPNKKGA